MGVNVLSVDGNFKKEFLLYFVLQLKTGNYELKTLSSSTLITHYFNPYSIHDTDYYFDR